MPNAADEVEGVTRFEDWSSAAESCDLLPLRSSELRVVLFMAELQAAYYESRRRVA
jgi:hypothetical protein